ncbi:hypothetical protein AB0L41_47745 [Amycolatopsis mediterranei]|uniref:sensor histidine kinase n=1 Tax=Amycolatopsis mediterranei TaxID=33910 RepID=UPI00342F0CA6
MRVDVQWHGERRPLPPDIDTSAFRIVQESLTNVVRHAGTTACVVSLDYRDEELAIEVTDRGLGGDDTHKAPATAWPACESVFPCYTASSVPAPIRMAASG